WLGDVGVAVTGQHGHRRGCGLGSTRDERGDESVEVRPGHDQPLGGMTTIVALSGEKYLATTRLTSAAVTRSISSTSRMNEVGSPVRIHDRPIASASPVASSSENTKPAWTRFLALRSSSALG